MSERMDELMKAAAVAFREGMNPFATDWLVEHDVSLDECVLLGDNIAECIDGQVAARAALREMARAVRK